MTQTPTARMTRFIDMAVIGWVILWVALGALCFVEVRGLTSLSDTMQVAGESLQQAGDALGTAAAVPLIGGGIRPAAQRVQTLADETVAQAEESRTHITRLSWLALVVGGVMPIAMAVGVYVPLRRSWTQAPREGHTDTSS